MNIPPWYVITGVPSSGKTILIERLKELGFHIVPETARVLIDEHLAKGISVEELRRNDIEFQRRVLQTKLEIEERTPKNRIVFLDRGIPDSIAYFQIGGLDTQEVEKLSGGRYRKIFFLEQLPFQRDYARTEDEATVRKLNQLLAEVYENLGYEVIRVPAVSVEERLQLILSNL